VTRSTFLTLLNKDSHDSLVKEGKRKFSQKATLNALFILLYRNEPLLTQPHNLLKSIIDIDTNFTEWRHRHALLAHRMLGTKIGTGGTAGHEYLRKAAINNQIYFELI
jgi:tryptophan 2,3-dioxygenase